MPNHGTITIRVTRHLFVASMAIASAMTAAPVAVASNNFTAFDVPGSSGTYVRAINSKNDIAGWYADSDGNQHGFIRSKKGKFTTFDADGASSETVPKGINDGGTVTGTYLYGAFVRDPDGSISTFFPTNGSYTDALSINASGEVAGYYSDPEGAIHGFYWTAGGGVISFDVPNASATFGYSINDSGAISGYYQDSSGNAHGFVRAPNGSYTSFDVSGDTGGTYPRAIAGKNDVTGWYSNGSQHGFFLSAKGKIVSFDPSGSTYTDPQAINSRGAVTGGYDDNQGEQHGFMRAKNGSITTFDPTGSTYTSPEGINTHGYVTGSYADENGDYHGFVGNP